MHAQAAVTARCGCYSMRMGAAVVVAYRAFALFPAGKGDMMSKEIKRLFFNRKALRRLRRENKRRNRPTAHGSSDVKERRRRHKRERQARKTSYKGRRK